MRTTAAGSPAAVATKLDEAGGETKHSWPQFLADGRHVLYFSQNRDPAKSGIYVQELGSSHRVLVTRNLTRGVWAPPGHLLYVREATLFAHRMDPRSFQLTGDPTPAGEDVSANEGNGRSAFAVSGNGVLVYRTGVFTPGDSRLMWVDRKGAKLSYVGQPGNYQTVRLSPDEKSALVRIRAASGADSALVDLATGVRAPVTTDGKTSRVTGPFSPDSRRIAINRNPDTILEHTVASGTTRDLKAAGLYANDWTPDGAFLICTDMSGTRLGLLSLDGGGLRVLSDTPYRKIGFRLSPDGKFVAYTSYESGTDQVAVASFPSFAERRQISIANGRNALWRKDGRELYFRTDDNLMAAEIRTGPRIESGAPKILFPVRDLSTASMVAPSGDGQRFLLIDYGERVAIQDAETIIVVNWAADLK
jgi:Tol biopolymer transport system component